MILPAIELEGSLQPDGSLILDEKPTLPPGRVRVALQPLPESPTGTARLPDAPWLDDSISAPFDLPRPGVAERVRPRVVHDRLPELPAGLAEDTQ